MLLLVLVLVLVGMVLTGVLLVLAEAAAASRAVQSAAVGKIVGGVPERQLIASFLLDDAEDETGEGTAEEGRTVVLVLAVVVVLLLDGAAAEGRAERAAAVDKIVGGVPERQLIVSFLRGVVKEGTAEEGGSLMLLVVVTVVAIGGNGVGAGGSIKFGVEGAARRMARDVTVDQAVGRTAVGRFDETGKAKLTEAVGGSGRFRSDGGEEKEAGVTVGSGLKTGEGRGDVAASRERNVTACNGEEKVREPFPDGLGLVRERRRD
jgi:hypothetical protein